jgi:hypothetical protein
MGRRGAAYAGSRPRGLARALSNAALWLRARGHSAPFGVEAGVDAVSNASELLAAVDDMALALERRGIAYFITGSVASSVHGEYRATNDVDIVADITVSDLEPLFAELDAQFVADVDQARDALELASSFNLIHRASFLKIDVFPCLTAFDREAQRRAEQIVPAGGGQALRVATMEDILLSKLRWYRLGEESSEVQRRDIRGLVSLNRAELDMEYVRHWGAVLGVSDLIELFLPENEEPRP